jgi:hypothetical protein
VARLFLLLCLLPLGLARDPHRCAPFIATMEILTAPSPARVSLLISVKDLAQAERELQAFPDDTNDIIALRLRLEEARALAPGSLEEMLRERRQSVDAHEKLIWEELIMSDLKRRMAESPRLVDRLTQDLILAFSDSAEWTYESGRLCRRAMRAFSDLQIPRMEAKCTYGATWSFDVMMFIAC